LEEIKVIMACRDCLRQKAIVEAIEDGGLALADRVDDGYGLMGVTMRRQPDAVVLDADLEGEDIIRLITMVRQNSPSTCFVLVYGSVESVPLGEALRVGVSGFLSVPDLDGLVRAIRIGRLGGLYFGESLKERVLPRFSLYDRKGVPLPKPGRAHEMLNPTDILILQAIVRGDLDTKIADDLSLSSGYVRNCICRAKKKVGVKNRTQLGIYALSAGLISLEQEGDGPYEGDEAELAAGE